MSLANYSDLKTSVASWLHRDSLTAYIPDFIRLGEDRIYRELRIRAMEASLNSTIASGVIAVPADYIEMKYAYVNGSPVQYLQRKDPQWIYENYPARSAEGQPKYFAEEAGNFIFGPYPDSTYTIRGVYYKRLTALSDSNTTNWFMTNAPGILLFAALSETAPFLVADDRLALWNAKYEQERDGIQREDRREQHSGSHLGASISWG